MLSPSVGLKNMSGTHFRRNVLERILCVFLVFHSRQENLFPTGQVKQREFLKKQRTHKRLFWLKFNHKKDKPHSENEEF